MTDIDLHKAIHEREQKIDRLQNEVIHLRKTVEILEFDNSLTSVQGNTDNLSSHDEKPESKRGKGVYYKWGKPLPDFAIEILTIAKEPMHIEEIRKIILEQDIVKERIELLKENPSVGSVDVALRTDPLKRFTSLGGKVYDLANKN